MPSQANTKDLNRRCILDAAKVAARLALQDCGFDRLLC